MSRLRDAIEASMNDFSLGTEARLNRAEKRILAAAFDPTPSETALSAAIKALPMRWNGSPVHSYLIPEDYDLVSRKEVLSTLDAERASRSATEESLRAALDECRQHHADTLAGNERGQHRSATEGRRSVTVALDALRKTAVDKYVVGVPGQPSGEWRDGALWGIDKAAAIFAALAPSEPEAPEKP